MNTKILTLSMWISVSAALVCQSSFAEVCGASAFSGSSQAVSEAQWRQNITLASQDGAVPATSAAREKEMSERKDKMEREILGVKEYTGKGDTPPFEIFPAEGVKAKYVIHSEGLHQGNTRITLSNVGSADLHATLLAPVSGHVGATNAIAWSKVDTFDIRTDISRDKEGKQWNSYYNEDTLKPLIMGAKSMGLVTAQDINIPLNKDHVTRILYYRSGSGGPGGYEDGRVIELVWDGT